ncbi:hypothetical protein [Streptosporangium subroseum]|nr:hypothetical protein OHB15_47605 [Streptosporangium subroseum]
MRDVIHRFNEIGLACLDPNARHPDVLTVQRRELALIRSEKGIRWGTGTA